MSKNFVIGTLIGAILIIVAIGSYSFLHKNAITNFPPPNDTVVAFGDSLVQGVGSTKGHDWVNLVSERIGKPIINLGISGNTTVDGLNRLNEVTQMKPGVVLVLLGGNDYLRRLPQQATFANLADIIDRLQEAGSVVVLIGVRGGILSDHFESSFKELARLKHTFYVPNILDGLLGDTKLMSDEVHPNDAGYRVVADKIYPVLKEALGDK